MCNTSRTFTEREKSILKIIQKNLPDSLTPFADIAKMVDCSEEEVLQLLQSMKEEGYIRRFGASLKHQNAGYKNNVMVTWKVTTDIVDSAGNAMAKHPMISHCYYRPSQIPDWPFELYTMIHGRSLEECEKVIADCIEVSGLTEYIVLKSIKELKKTSMMYF